MPEKSDISIIYYIHVTINAGSNCPHIPIIRTTITEVGTRLGSHFLLSEGMSETYGRRDEHMEKIALAVISFIAAVIEEIMKSEED